MLLSGVMTVATQHSLLFTLLVAWFHENWLPSNFFSGLRPLGLLRGICAMPVQTPRGPPTVFLTHVGDVLLKTTFGSVTSPPPANTSNFSGFVRPPLTRFATGSSVCWPFASSANMFTGE